MSKNAVSLLLIFILGIIFVEPLITRGLTLDSQLVTVRNQQLPSNSNIIGGDTLLSNTYLPYPNPDTEDSCILNGIGSVCQKTRLKATVVRTVITAYSSSPDETDNTPFITASGSYAHYGTAAANFLPFGTRIRLPEIFGDQIFTIEDRLNPRYNDRIDIWLAGKGYARNFGVKVSEAEIL